MQNKQKNVSLEDIIEAKNISASEINSSPALKLIFEKSDIPTVFLPNYGEFGAIMNRVMRIVHFHKTPHKVVCCKKGEEALYPSADEFYYDWENFVEEKHRWGTFSKANMTGIGDISEKYRYYKKRHSEEVGRIQSVFGDNCHYVQLWTLNKTTAYDKYTHLFKFKLYPRIINNIKVDIVIGPRKRASRETNNFAHWDKIIEEVNKKGYSVGCIGAKDTSFVLKDSVANSWDYADHESAAIEMLSNCKLYVGVDSGISLLPDFMSVPMILFSTANLKVYYADYMKKITPYCKDLGKNVQDISVILSAIFDFVNYPRLKPWACL